MINRFKCFALYTTLPPTVGMVQGLVLVLNLWSFCLSLLSSWDSVESLVCVWDRVSTKFRLSLSSLYSPSWTQTCKDPRVWAFQGLGLQGYAAITQSKCKCFYSDKVLKIYLKGINIKWFLLLLLVSYSLFVIINLINRLILLKFYSKAGKMCSFLCSKCLCLFKGIFLALDEQITFRLFTSPSICQHYVRTYHSVLLLHD